MIREYWNQLAERDQWALLIGGISLTLLMLYQLIYSPLSDALSVQTQQLQEKHATLRWMQSVRGQVQAGHSTQQRLNTSKLLAVINQQLGSGDLKPFPFQLQQGGNAEIQLAFEQVPATFFMQWLWQLHQNYTFNIKQLQIDNLAEAGMVKVNLSLEPTI
ncbi:MAG: type II secretion system protein M [Legionellaceae bacterium]|nr:type II secretion system protein M [Legionellaceae bacterium]